MKNLKTVYLYIIAYLAWIAGFLLWFFFIVLSRTALMDTLVQFYVNGDFQHGLEARFFDRAYLFIVGLIWLVLMIVTEYYFRTGVAKGLLARRIGIILGIEMGLIFLADLVLASLILINIGFLAWERWLQLFVELAATAAFAFLAVKSNKKPRPVVSMSSFG